MEKEKFPMEEISIVHKLPELISAGSVHGGEPKTQSCSVNNSEGNTNAGLEGEMVGEQREEFLAVWAHMVETGQDKILKDIIENKVQQSIVVRIGKEEKQMWGITVFGIYDYL